MFRSCRTVRNKEEKMSFSKGSYSSVSLVGTAFRTKREIGRFGDRTLGHRDCCNPHGLKSWRVTLKEKYQVLCSFWGVISSKGAAISLSPRVSLSLSSSVSVFVCLHLHQSLSQCQVVGPEGISCLSSVLHGGSGNHYGVCVLSLCGTLQRWSVTGELIVKRPLLFCDVLSQLTSKSFGCVSPHIKFNYIYWVLNSQWQY